MDEYLEGWYKVDKDMNEIITYDEMMTAFPEMSQEDIQSAITHMDLNEDGEVDVHEGYEWFSYQDHTIEWKQYEVMSWAE